MPKKESEGDEDTTATDKTVPGGVYQGADGKYHDAHGRPVTEDGELIDETMPDVANFDDQAWRDDMEAQRVASAEGTASPAPRARRPRK
jgi:hypothetical protein